MFSDNLSLLCAVGSMSSVGFDPELQSGSSLVDMPLTFFALKEFCFLAYWFGVKKFMAVFPNRFESVPPCSWSRALEWLSDPRDCAERALSLLTGMCLGCHTRMQYSHLGTNSRCEPATSSLDHKLAPTTYPCSSTEADFIC